ncbi:MAG TPA: hypothetical protein V6C81_22165 [Planktothrix sp.]|jgi:hypothetical protein
MVLAREIGESSSNLSYENAGWRSVAAQSQEGSAAAAQSATSNAETATPYLTNLRLTGENTGEEALAAQASNATGQNELNGRALSTAEGLSIDPGIDSLGSGFAINTGDTAGGGQVFAVSAAAQPEINADMGGLDFGTTGQGWDNTSSAGTTASPGWQAQIDAAENGTGDWATALGALAKSYPNDAADASLAGNQYLQATGYSDGTTYFSSQPSTGKLSVTPDSGTTEINTNVGPDVQSPQPTPNDNPNSSLTDPGSAQSDSPPPQTDTPPAPQAPVPTTAEIETPPSAQPDGPTTAQPEEPGATELEEVAALTASYDDVGGFDGFGGFANGEPI